MIVTIPARENHDGLGVVTVEISDVCPVCGGPRGEKRSAISFDGSRRLYCDGWDNPCGHIDKYSAVRREAIERYNSK